MKLTRDDMPAIAIRLFWMMRQGWNYEQVMKFGSHVEQPGHRDGVR
jgi:mannose/fructose/N-acetylgalactosamine-specific phosphotransferase system component IID